jgi:hypothetical protein
LWISLKSCSVTARWQPPQKADEYGIRQETTAFVNLLLEAAKQRTCPIYVVLTMRSNFLGDCAQFAALPEAINEGHYLVPRMTRDERRAAIGGPVAVRGAEISPVLLTRLVNDVGDDPDQLSILQHALNRTWAKWQEQDGIGPLDLKHYLRFEVSKLQHENQWSTAANHTCLLAMATVVGGLKGDASQAIRAAEIALPPVLEEIA